MTPRGQFRTEMEDQNGRPYTATEAYRLELNNRFFSILT